MYGCVRQGTVCLLLLKYQLIRIGIIIWIQHKEYAFVFLMIAMNYLFKLANGNVGCARQPVPGNTTGTRERRCFQGLKKCAKEGEFLLTGAGCSSWTEDFLFMAHYNRLFSQVPPQKMYEDYSPSGVRVEIDAWFPNPWLFFFPPSFSSYLPC